MKRYVYSLIAVTAVATAQPAVDANTTAQMHTDAPRSVRDILAEETPIERLRAQWRTGFITLNQTDTPTLNGYATGGHLHLDTKRYGGIKAGISLYAVADMGFNQNDTHKNPDFFDANGEGFVTLSEAYLDGKWETLNVVAGRQRIDTPHADSDDIRMMPNMFEAYRIISTAMPRTALEAGYIRKMAGWENGMDAASFERIDRVLGASQKTDGVAYLSATFEQGENLTLSLWGYRFFDIADIYYAEAGYNLIFSDGKHLVLGLQADYSDESGKALLGRQAARTWGVSAEYVDETVGWHVLAAYNRDNGATGATSLNLGGGALFTSMEDQTLDAMGTRGDAVMAAAGYHFDMSGIGGLDGGVAYARFKADDGSYDATEVDIACSYALSDVLSVDAVYADTSFSDTIHTDYDMFRLIVRYDFK